MNRNDKGNGRDTSGRRAAMGAHAHASNHQDQESMFEHRRKLEALFSGGSSPARSESTASNTPAKSLFATQEKAGYANQRRSVARRQMTGYRERLYLLQAAREPEQIAQAVKIFLDDHKHQLPDDLEILLKVLQHPVEKYWREAMGQISALLSQGRVPVTVILEDRLKDLATRAQEPATLSYIDGLRKQIESSKKPG